VPKLSFKKAYRLILLILLGGLQPRWQELDGQPGYRPEFEAAARFAKVDLEKLEKEHGKPVEQKETKVTKAKAKTKGKK
jgi:hypothetical protein